MMKRVPLMALAAFLLCAHGACRRSADARNLATVDSLYKVTDSLLQGMKALDIVRVGRLDSLYALKADRVLERMRDTLRKEDAIALGNYHRTMTKYPRLAREGSRTVMERLEMSRGQLSDLRNDVNKGLLEPAQETRYINDERIVLADVRGDAAKVAASVATILRDDAQYGAVIDSLLEKDIPAVQ